MIKKTSIMMRQLRDIQNCYVCGRENPVGLAVEFQIDAEARAIRAKFIPKDAHQGYEGIVHGGILSALLDEAMAKLAFSLGIPAVTAEITIKFKSPASPGEELNIFGMLLRETHGLIHAEAKIERGTVLVAEAAAKLLRIN